MHFALITAALFVALVAAGGDNAALHFQHRRAVNATASGPSTTLTVFQTIVQTITSCAPTITDCPARSSAGNGVITDTIALTTTVCPASAAQSIASSVLDAAGGAVTGASSQNTAKTPISTGVNGAGGAGSAPAAGGSGLPSSIITNGLGAGSSVTTSTTTIVQTLTSTQYFTDYVTISRSSTAAVAASSGAAGAQTTRQTAATNVPEAQAEPTTTLTSSYTVTRYVTVKVAASSPVSPSSSPSPAGAVSGVGVAGGSGSGSGNCAPVTVTVALSTVTVTYNPMAALPTGAPPSPVTTAGRSNAPGGASNPAKQASASSIVRAPAVTVSVISSSALFGNGTTPTIKSANSIGSTGFLTKVTPTNSMAGYDHY